MAVIEGASVLSTRTVVALAVVAAFGIVPINAQTSLDSDDSERRETLLSSLRLAALQHALRVALEDKTRGALGGPFLADYWRALRIPGQWGDGDSAVTNYIGHPVQGAASGFIWLAGDRRAPREFVGTKEYWGSRLRATAWAAGYSAQFEVGPFSEASIGNVGTEAGSAGWVDHVVTPLGGFALMVGEDAIDRFVNAPLERRVRSRVLKAALRVFLNPARSSANVAGLRTPWYRPDRPISGEPATARQ